MSRYDLGSTQPLPLILTLAQGQPATPRRGALWAPRSVARMLAHWMLAGAGAVLMFLLYTHAIGG